MDLENNVSNLDFEHKENHLQIKEVYLGGNVIAVLLNKNVLATIDEREMRKLR